MKSRLAILGMLVTGMFLSTAGAGLAITGLAGSDDASVAQYGPGTLTTESENDDGGQVLPAQSQNSPGSGDALQPRRQVESGVDAGGDDTGGDLPFTGFAAIPILIGGVALLSGGLVMRRRTDDD